MWSDAGLLARRPAWPSASFTVLASGFSQKHDLAGLGRRDRDLGVAVAGRADVDDVDVRAVDDLAPVGGRFLPAELLGRGRFTALASRPQSDLHAAA